MSGNNSGLDLVGTSSLSAGCVQNECEVDLLLGGGTGLVFLSCGERGGEELSCSKGEGTEGEMLPPDWAVGGGELVGVHLPATGWCAWLVETKTGDLCSPSSLSSEPECLENSLYLTMTGLSSSDVVVFLFSPQLS